jgi:TRAP-type C4-dicarboxylate transport system permease small subunit
MSRSNRLPFVVWLLCLSFAIVFGTHGWVAVTERWITTGGRTGIHHSEGLSAVVQGCFFLGVAVASLGLLAMANRFKRLICDRTAILVSHTCRDGDYDA